jgi:transcriptional regulator
MEKRDTPTGDLVQGTLDMLILKTLSRGRQHGYGIGEWIRRTSDGLLRIEEGALYPALHRLEIRGLLAAEWGVSKNNRRAKFYCLTATGRKHLEQTTARWSRMTGAIDRVMQTA